MEISERSELLYLVISESDEIIAGLSLNRSCLKWRFHLNPSLSNRLSVDRAGEELSQILMGFIENKFATSWATALGNN